MVCGSLKNRCRLLKAGLCSCLLSISVLLVIIFCLFPKISQAQFPRNQLYIYTDINYYPNYVLDGVPRNVHLLDIYKPEACQSCPVIMYIHGGSWVFGDKGDLSYKAKAFTTHGYIYVSINYRLSPDYRFPVHAYDVARAFSWLKNNIADYGGNPEQIYLLGHSAGGHLAALIALDEHYLEAFGLIPANIAGVIGLDSAAYHLPSLFAAEPENQYLFYWAFGDNPKDWAIASPINYIREGKIVPPFLLLVAGDRKISKTNNEYFYQQLLSVGNKVTLLSFPEKDHVSIDYELGKEDDLTFKGIINWLEKLENN